MGSVSVTNIWEDLEVLAHAVLATSIQQNKTLAFKPIPGHYPTIILA